MPTVNLSPLFNDAQLDSSGNPYSGAFVFTYAAGSSTKTNTYTTSGGTVAQANPIVLNSRGEPANPIWLIDGTSYKFVLASPTDSDPPLSPIRTIDNITGINDVAATAQSEWIAGATPTYISATTFSLVGDQTTDFHVGRRLKTTNTGGTIYSTIAKSAFTTLTTVTVVNDSGSLDSGLSATFLGLITTSNTSLPLADASILSWNGPLTPHENLVVTRPSVATLTITADKLIVTDTNGRKAALTSVSVTPNITASGANGLDTGSEAANTWYYAWVIWNGATVAGLLSTSATAPTMPSGYTHKGLAGAVRNGAADFVDTTQQGNLVSIPAQTALTDGSATSATSVALSSFVPPAARVAYCRLNVTATAATAVNGAVYSDSGGTVLGAHLGNASTGSVGTLLAVGRVMLRTAQTVWYTVSDASCDLTLVVTGWEW